MTKEITLTRGLVAIVDNEDYSLVSKYKWYAQPGTNTFYAARRGPRDSEGKRKTLYMHRLIMGMDYWEPGGLECDHINRDGLDNRRSNLRAVTHQENRINSDNMRSMMNCPTCNNEFYPSHAKAKFCSISCSRRQPEHGSCVRKLSDRECPYCHKMFRPYNHTSKYCSGKCRSLGMWEIRKLGLR